MKKLHFILAILINTCLFVQGTTIPANPVTAGSPIFIELGSGTIKAGLASQANPITFPAVVAKSGTTYYVGDEAMAKSKSMGLTLKYPIEHGTVNNWTETKEILRYAFAQLNVDPAHHEVLITENVLNPKPHREALTSMLFNDFNVKGVYLAKNVSLALYATGRNTGLVFHSEEGVSHIVPIYEGYVLPHALLRMDLGNRDLADYMVQKLKSKGHNISREVAYDIMKKTGYVAYYANAANSIEHFTKEMVKPEGQLMKSYQLPGGQTITIGKERFNVVEALFQPSFLGMASAGIDETVYNAIMKCDVDHRKTLYANTVFSGIGSTYPGIVERMTKEVGRLAPPIMNVVITAPENREHLVWEGGKILAPLLSSNNLWVTRAEFDAEGPGIVHKKCF